MAQKLYWDSDRHIVAIVGTKEAVVCMYDHDRGDCRGRKPAEWTELIKLAIKSGHPEENIRLRTEPCPFCVKRKPRY